MASNQPWAGIDPNTQHQLWSEWRFEVFDCGKHPPFEDVKTNAARWVRMGFGSVGRMRVEERVRSWAIVVQVEGVPANDPSYVRSVRQQFQKHFVEKGWGPLAVGIVEVKLLAGDIQDGKPPQQLVVMPGGTNRPGTRWQREPSAELCGEQCGAKCCRGPGSVTLTKAEAARLRAKNRGFNPEPAENDRYVVRWAEDEHCAFLGADNLCTIYSERPLACRRFPMKPYPNCLVWSV